MLARILPAILLIPWCASRLGAEPPPGACAESLDPLVAALAEWTGAYDSALDYRFAAFCSGAGLALGRTAQAGFTLPARQQLRWPGNLFAAVDSNYAPQLPASWAVAESLLVHRAASGAELLLFGPTVRISGLDTSLGVPWFFVTYCDSSGLASQMWDLGDLKARWWRRLDLPGANSIWVLPELTDVRLGRAALRHGMRSLVLSARPDSTGSERFGLAALRVAAEQAHVEPGRPAELQRIAGLRAACGEFLVTHLDLWPPARREPLKLAAFYLNKDAEAWRTLAAAAASWHSFDRAQRAAWLGAIVEWETKAAVALDQVLSGPE